MSTDTHNPSPAPPQPLVLRAAILTALFYLGLIGLYFFAYYRRHTTFTLSDFMQLSFISVGIGILLGILVIWLVFPKSYAPKESHEFFPKVFWVGGWHLILFPPLFFVLAGINPFNFTHVHQRIDSHIWIDSPFLYTIGCFSETKDLPSIRRARVPVLHDRRSEIFPAKSLYPPWPPCYHKPLLHQDTKGRHSIGILILKP